MIPWELVERVSTPDGNGELSLHRRGEEFSIRIDGGELMNSRMHASEQAMAKLTSEALSGTKSPRILVGGLGMGFTLAACNRHFPDTARIEVVELLDAVIEWNRGSLGVLAGEPLRDPRVQIRPEDIRQILEAPGDPYDAILLDVDNGPEGLTQASNQWLYGNRGLSRQSQALRSGGVLSVWSARPAAAFTGRLRRAGFQVAVHTVSARPAGAGPKHTIWVAKKPA